MDNTKTSDFTPPDGGYGWIIVLATTLINISILPFVQNFGLIFKGDFEAMKVTSAETSFMLHLHSAIYCCLGLLGSPLLKKFNFRQVALFGTCIMSVGIFLSSFTKNYTLLICTFPILVGIGQGIMLPATYLATNSYFKKRLTLAISFSVTGASISNILMPLICSKLLEKLSSAQVVLVLAAISVIAIGCCFLLKPVKSTTVQERKEQVELINSVYRETTISKEKTNLWKNLYNMFNLELLKDRPYVIAIIGMSISFASELNVILMIAFILSDLASFQTKDVAIAMSVQSVADIVGRIGVPLIAHHFNVPAKLMYGIALTTATIGRTGIAVFYSSRVAIFGCMCFIGLAKGIKAVYQSVIIPKHVDLDKLPAANGLNMLLTGSMNLALGPIMGAIHDVTGSYIYTLHTASLLSMLCVCLWIGHFLIFQRKTTQT